MILQNKVALITGGNAGIGRATAELFAREGANVVVAARREDRSKEVVEAIESDSGTAVAIPLDVRSAEDCQKSVAAALAAYGRLDILVNNAGVILRNQTVAEIEIQAWQDLFDVNVLGTFLMSKFALPHLLAAEEAAIVNVASYFGLVGGAGLAAYCASKGAMVQLTRAMALDHATQGLRVNCVCPGAVRTPMLDEAWSSYGEGASEVWAAKHPLGRVAEPEEVAQSILYLASPASSFITGAALPVDGGITAA